MHTFNEIVTMSETSTVKAIFNSLSAPERVFVYVMQRAILPFNRIYRDQNHRHSNDLIEFLEHLLANETLLASYFVNQVKMYLVYLWICHGTYFLREDGDNKRTPHRLGLNYLTMENFQEAAVVTDYGKNMDFLGKMLDPNVEKDYIVSGSIEKSSNNFYGPEFTKEHYQSFPSEIQNRLNVYFDLDNQGKPCATYYSTQGKYADELKVSVYWLRKILDHVKMFSDHFDSHLVNSIRLLIEYFESGDEAKYKEHCIEWLQTSSNVDYTLGFIEKYHDPNNIRGDARGEVTVKTVPMKKLTSVLLEIEQNIPVAPEYKRNNTNAVMNTSVNQILFSAGAYGPAVIVAAYCLPNYDDIRTQYGSKQVIYKLPDSLEGLLDPLLYNQFRSSSETIFINKYDPEDKLTGVLWDVQVILHETIGHASGKLHKHTFKEGENLVIKGVTYNVGDTIDVTTDNLSEFLKNDQCPLEELRAEINALYMSIAEMDRLNQEGLFKDWLSKLSKRQLQEQCIIKMCNHMFRRYLLQAPDMTEIKGAHAKANISLANYLLASGGVKIIDESKIIDGTTYHLLDFEVTNFEQAWKNIIELVQIVQLIKSTGDGVGCKELFEKYTKYPVTIEMARKYRQYLVEKRNKLIGNRKMRSRLFYNYVPILTDNVLTDVKIDDELMDVFEQNKLYARLMLSTTY